MFDRRLNPPHSAQREQNDTLARARAAHASLDGFNLFRTPVFGRRNLAELYEWRGIRLVLPAATHTAGSQSQTQDRVRTMWQAGHPGLKIQLQSGLHLSRLIRLCGDLPEGSIANGRIRSRELDPIEHIERFQADFETSALAETQGDLLEE
jgi:hypothetical protein